MKLVIKIIAFLLLVYFIKFLITEIKKARDLGYLR